VPGYATVMSGRRWRCYQTSRPDRAMSKAVPPAPTTPLSPTGNPIPHTKSTPQKVGRFSVQTRNSPRNSAQNKTVLTAWKTRFWNEAEGARTLNLRIDSPML
jgi:hypothetical protein